MENNREDKSSGLLGGFVNLITENSKQFRASADKIVYSLLALAWATIFAVKPEDGKEKAHVTFLYVAVLAAILYWGIELIYRYYMERVARSLHKQVQEQTKDDLCATNEWNAISDRTSYILLLKVVLIFIMATCIGAFFVFQL